jgi:hypothetical protein
MTTAVSAESPATHAEGVTVGLTRLDAIVRRAFAAAADHPALDPLRGLRLDAETITRTLAQPPCAPAFDASRRLPDAYVAGCPLWALASAFELTPFDVDVLLIALGPDLDVRYERLYAYLQDDVTRRRPTVSLALDLLCATVEDKLAGRSHFAPGAALLRHRLIEWEPDPHHPAPSLLSQPFRIDEQIVRFLLGDPGLDSRLAECVTIEQPSAALDHGAVEAGIAARLGASVARAAARREPLTLAFHGRDARAARAAAQAVAATAGRSLLVADLGRIADVSGVLPIAVREAELRRAVVALDHWDGMRDPSQAAQLEVDRALAEWTGIAIVCGAARWVPGPHGPKDVVSCLFEALPFESAALCWERAIGLVTGRADVDLAATLAGRFRLSADQIEAATLAARRRADSRAGSPDRVAHPDAADFFAGARQQSSDELARIASRVVASATWTDIVLPDDALAQLREICGRVAHGRHVLDRWGFGRRLSHGKGTVALFSGPSGTGKTMAAEVLANELGLDLYRVEIPSVVSKWIGETEKNLDRVFQLADNAILFFDEADALFGKRSEVRDAHDRYANVEVSYLLQRMETFDGLAILATNVRHHMDEAFLRRLSFLVQFPFPDDGERQRIWERIWPEETPLSADLDFERLARTFKLAGGNVKNVALAAAFSAAARGEAVATSDILHAIRREYQKLGKSLDERELSLGLVPAIAGALR